MAQDRYHKPFGGRYESFPATHWFWALLIAGLHLLILLMGILILTGTIHEAQWILDRWPYPTPKP